MADLAPLMRIKSTLEAWPKLLCFANQSHDQRFLYLGDSGVEAEEQLLENTFVTFARVLE